MFNNKRDDNKSHHLFYGANDVLLLESLKEFLHVVKSEEYQWIENNLFDLIA